MLAIPFMTVLRDVVSGLVVLTLIDILLYCSLFAMLISFDDDLDVFLTRVVVITVAIQHVLAHGLSELVFLFLICRPSPIIWFFLSLVAFVLFVVSLVLVIVYDVLPFGTLALGRF